MSAVNIALIYLPFLAYTATMWAGTMRRPVPPAARALRHIAATAFGWQLMALLYQLSDSPAAAAFFYSIDLPFVAFSTLFLFLYVIRLYHLDYHIRSDVVIPLSIIPCVTAALCLTTNHHSFVRRTQLPLAADSANAAPGAPGLWFYVHTLYCYVLLAIMLYIIIRQHLRLPKTYRFCSSMLLSGFLVAIFTNLLTLVVRRFTTFDFSVIGISIGLLMIHVAMGNNRGLDFLLTTRMEVFNYLDQAMYVLDEEREILECNTVACRWLEKLGITCEPGSSFQALQDALKQCGASFNDSLGEGVDVELMFAPINMVFNMREHRVCDRAGATLGYVVACTDVTQNRMMLKLLDQTAGLDALTGLPNRHKLEEVCRRYDEQGVPVTAVVGDINGLKPVNDTQGHHQGDNLIQVVAQALSRCCPPGGAVFRIGGDEFIALLHGGEELAEDFITAVHDTLEEETHYPFTPAISMGYAVREHGDQSVWELLREADEDMYAHKRHLRH